MARRQGLMGVALCVALLTAGCGSGGTSGSAVEQAPSPADPAKVSGEVTVLTNRTDMIVDGTWQRYADEFTRSHPDVRIKFEGVTDYEGEVKIRMNTDNYGDVLLIPQTIAKDDYPKFFASLGDAASLGGKYLFTDNAKVGDAVYGLASFAAANGFVYNKEVWAQAGVTGWPTSPQEFLSDLTAIKSKTSAISFYTNYKDGWPLSAWSNVLGSATCDAKANDALATSTAPWAAGSDLEIGDRLLHDIVHGKLSEPDPTTTNWEDSKGLLATGQIGTMWLGSWSIAQLREAAKKAGKDPAVIGYLPFPTQVDGAYCSAVAADYLLAVNKHSSVKPAARAWIDWLLDKSDFVTANQAVSSVRGAPKPDVLAPFTEAGVRFVELSQADTAKVNSIDDASEIGLRKPEYRQHLIDVARGAAPGDLQGTFDELNGKWADAVQTVGG